jgi:hypothetical protein
MLPRGSAGLETVQQQTHQVLNAAEFRLRVGRVLGRERGGAVQGGAHGERETGGVPSMISPRPWASTMTRSKGCDARWARPTTSSGASGLCLRAIMGSTTACRWRR